MDREKGALIEKNKNLAEKNLQSWPEYTETREKLVQAHQDALAIQQQARDKQTRLSCNQHQNSSPDVLRGLLQVAAHEAEEQSEALAKRFVTGQCAYEQFLEQFLPLRTLSHARRIKYDKLTEHIRRNPQSLNRPTGTDPSASVMHSQPPTTTVTSHASIPPYPSMPMHPYAVPPMPPRTAPMPPYVPASINAPYPPIHPNNLYPYSNFK